MIRKTLVSLLVPVLILSVAAAVRAGAVSYCTGAPNSTGVGAQLQWTGSFDLVGGGLYADDCPADAFGMVLYSLQPQDIPFGDGHLCVGPPAWILARTHTTAQGDASIDLRRDGDAEDLRWLNYHYGMTWYFQFAYRDPGGPLGTGFNLTDALEVVFE